jgi:hypothetical protein
VVAQEAAVRVRAAIAVIVGRVGYRDLDLDSGDHDDRREDCPSGDLAELIADRSHDSDAFRVALSARGTAPCIPLRKHGKLPIAHDANLHRQRHPRGYGVAEWVVGRKRVALLEAEGYWLVVAVTPASVRERDTLGAPAGGEAARRSLRVAILDGAFTTGSCRKWSNLHGMRHEAVTRSSGQKGFVVLPRCCVAERSIG